MDEAEASLVSVSFFEFWTRESRILGDVIEQLATDSVIRDMIITIKKIRIGHQRFY